MKSATCSDPDVRYVAWEGRGRWFWQVQLYNANADSHMILLHGWITDGGEATALCDAKQEYFIWMKRELAKFGAT